MLAPTFFFLSLILSFSFFLSALFAVLVIVISSFLSHLFSRFFSLSFFLFIRLSFIILLFLSLRFIPPIFYSLCLYLCPLYSPVLYFYIFLLSFFPLNSPFVCLAREFGYAQLFVIRIWREFWIHSSLCTFPGLAAFYGYA